MSNINRVILSGNLTRDPELKVTQSGTSVLSFGIAVSDRKNASGEAHTNFFECTVWGKYGETMERHLQKGQKVTVSGSLHYSSWERDGKKRNRVEVYVREIDAFGPARDARGQEGPKAATPSHEEAEVYDDDIPF